MAKLILCVSLMTLLIACDKEDVLQSTNTSSSILTSALTGVSGFVISEFVEEGVNKTSTFAPFVFVFDTDGLVTASSINQTISGTYLVFTDDGKTELSMNFPGNSEFTELSDDWYLISQNETTIRLEDNGDILEFIKQ